MRSPTSRVSKFVVHAKLFTFTCVTASLVHTAVVHLNRQLAALTQSITIEQYFACSLLQRPCTYFYYSTFELHHPTDLLTVELSTTAS
jgi:hypothetical protein